MQLPQYPARLASACLLAIGLAGCQTGGQGLLSCLCPQSAPPSQSSRGQRGCGQAACVEGQCGPHVRCTDTACQATRGHKCDCAATGGCRSSCSNTSPSPDRSAPRGCLSKLCASSRGNSTGSTNGGSTNGGCVSGGCVSGGCAATVAVPPGRTGECLLEPEPPSRHLGRPAPMAPLVPQQTQQTQQTPSAPHVELKNLPPAGAEQPPAGAYRNGATIPSAEAPAWRYDSQAPPPPLPTGAMIQRPAVHQVMIVPAGSAASLVTIRETMYETAPVQQAAPVQEFEPIIPAATPIETPFLDATPLSPQPIEVLQPVAPMTSPMTSSRPVDRSTGKGLSKPWADALGLDASDPRREVPLACDVVPSFRGQSGWRYASDGSRSTSQPVLRVVEQSDAFAQPTRY